MFAFYYRLKATVGIAVGQLRGQPTRTVLVVVGVGLAVLSATLLAGVGLGVLETGEEKFAQADRDLWLTGGPLAFLPDGPTAVENTIHDSHAVAEEIAAREDVKTAAPIGFEAVYVGTNESNVRLLTGVGVTNTHGGISIQAGRDFEGHSPHYANGTYEGEMTRSVIVDPRTAELFDLEPGDEISVGGSRSAATDREFTVVGIAPTTAGCSAPRP
jgi:putative ABC transport system permease protein